MISSSKSIAINYVKGWFFLDLIAALPFEIFGGYFMVSDEIFKTFSIVFKVDFYFYSFSKGQCNAASVLIDVLLFQSSNLHLLKLTRLLRLARLIQKMDR